MNKEGIIHIKASPSGEVVVSVDGVKGPACLAFTENIENALGSVKERTETEAMMERPLNAEHTVQH